MRWWRKRKKACPESERAVKESEQHLQEAQEQWSEVHQVSRSLPDHFAEAIEDILRGHPT